LSDALPRALEIPNLPLENVAAALGCAKFVLESAEVLDSRHDVPRRARLYEGSESEREPADGVQQLQQAEAGGEPDEVEREVLGAFVPEGFVGLVDGIPERLLPERDDNEPRR